MALSAAQRTAFAHARSGDVLYLGSGAVRSGKTAACGAAFALYAASHPGDHVLVARTEAVAMRNVVRPSPLGILETLRAHGRQARVSGVDGRHIDIDEGRSRVWLIGASDISAIDRVAGATFVSGMIDELTRLHQGEQLFQMLWSRFSTSRRKLWATTNPGAVRHWAKRIVIDQAERYRARLVSFRMTDNPSLSSEIREGIAAGLHGHARQRLIEGLWVDPVGLVYPGAVEGAMPALVGEWSVGLDWASSGTFACVLLAHAGGRVHVAAERVYDHRERGPIAEAEQVERTAMWVREWTSEQVPVYGDPTTPTAVQEQLTARGLLWSDADNDVLEGIRSVSSAFDGGKLTIDPGCVATLREAAEYSWDERWADQGEDRPQKGADHCLDALRYAVHSPSPYVTAGYWG